MDTDEMLDEQGAPDGQAGEVVTPEGAAEIAPGSDPEGEQGAAVAEQPAREQQSHEDNRRYQAARQSGERDGFDRAMGAINGRIAKMGVPDPERPGRVIDSVDAFERFAKAFTRKQLADRAAESGRTVQELEEEDRIREAGTRALEAEREGQTARERAEKDARDFAARYPEVDLAQLGKSQAFRRFCGSRFGREPLADLYEDFRDIAAEAQKTASAKTAGKKGRDTGSGGGTGGVELSGSQRSALEEWNRDNPDMKMTEAEFAKYRRE